MLHVFRLMLYVMLQETLQHYKKRVQHYTRPRPLPPNTQSRCLAIEKLWIIDCMLYKTTA